MDRFTAKKKAALIVIAIVAVAVFGTFFYYFSLPRKKPLVGVIEIEGYLLFDVDKKLYLKAVETALENETIKAVVLRINSGGGLASICEEVYSGIKRLSERKPVVAVVEGIAASGGYYVALGADYIYVTPSSFVGNVGVIAYAPPVVLPSEAMLETGAYKYTGFSPREFPLVMEEIFESFLDTVRRSREGKLKIPLEEISTGKLFVGVDAVEAGLADEIGSYLDAVEKAAEMAEIEDYDVISLTKEMKISLEHKLSGYDVWREKGRIPLSLIINISNLGFKIFYLPPYMVEDFPRDYGFLAQFTNSIFGEEGNAVNSTGRILIDLTHMNVFPSLLLTEFMGRIVENGGKLYFLKTGNLEDALKDSPKVLIIFTPQKDYTDEEIKAIKEFVNKGGKLLIAHDPAAGFPSSINNIAQEFGMLFATGYLYSSKDKYGIYRNPIIRTFEENNLTIGLNELVVLTGTAIYTNATSLIRTSRNTYLSIVDEQGEYTIAAINGTTLALGDITFMLDPFIQLADNSRFLDNLVEWLLGEEREG